jgi:drug/metabolite transporter (DMT)-like permease
MINPFQMEQGNTFAGISFTILAAVTFGLYSAMGRTSIRRLRGITQTSLSFLFGSVFMIPILLIMDRPILEGITTDNIVMVLYIGIMITGLGYLFYFLAMGVSDAATASIVFFVKPALAPVFAVIALHEVIGVNGLIGILLIFIGSYINLREQRAKKMILSEKEMNHEEDNN